MAEQAARAAEGEEQKKGGKLKLILLAVVALLVLGGGGVGAAWFFGLLGGGSEAQAASSDESGKAAESGYGEAPAEEEAAPAGGEGDGEQGAGTGGAGADGVYFVDLPDVLVNLRSEGRRMRYLKLRVSLEVRDAGTAGAVRSLMPRVMDSLQLYLRSLSVDDVRGAIGMERLKEEMLARINRAIRPHRVDDVLFKEMLVQ